MTKIAVVTGAGRGIGRAISLGLGAAGWHVVLTGRSEGALAGVLAELEASGATGTVIPADVTDEEEVARLAAAVESEFGAADLLVNNSGVGGQSAPLWEQSLAEWRSTFEVNVDGVFLVCRALLPAMIAAGRGSIINIGSLTGKRPMAGRTPYAASKLALVGLTRTLAMETGPHGVRVNVVSPGAVDGERLNWVLENVARDRDQSVEQTRAEFAAQSAMHRIVTADDVARTVAFLASDAAANITGADIDVNAGLHMG